MRHHVFYLITLTLVSIFNSVSLAIEKTDPNTSVKDPNLIYAQMSLQALTGINQLDLHIHTPTKSLWDMNNLALSMRSKLEEHDIKIHDCSLTCFEKKRRRSSIPDTLTLSIQTYNIPESKNDILWTQASIKCSVILDTPGHQEIIATVWHSEPRLTMIKHKDKMHHISLNLLSHIDLFIDAWQKANDPVFFRLISKASLQTSIPHLESSYVASKKGKVFHRPHCSSAKKISPATYEQYTTRQAAIEAGKRACKRCKP